jgi:hypothetical protein
LSRFRLGAVLGSLVVILLLATGCLFGSGEASTPAPATASPSSRLITPTIGPAVTGAPETAVAIASPPAATATLASPTPAPTDTPAPTPIPPTATPEPFVTATTTPVLAGVPPAATYAPEPAWPTRRQPTPFPAPTEIPGAASLVLPDAPPLTAFTATLRPGSAGDLAGQSSRSAYQIALRLDPDAQQLLGRERITLTNRSTTPLTRVIVRLYPNFPGIMDERDSSLGFPRLRVGAATVGTAPADVGYLDHNTAAAILLPDPLKPGERTSVELQFRLSTRGLGPAPDMWYFKSFYPMLAVYDASGWRMDVTNFPDQVYAETSFYTVDFDAPATLTVASSGTETGRTATGDRVVHHILAGPMREFAATAGRRYQQQTRQVDGITVRATALLTDTAQMNEDLGIAAQALDVYSQTFGPYPFNDFDLLLTPDGAGGIEFPGYVMISYLPSVNELRAHVVAHEVAHQWWYSLVGDDIFREAWLDEAFADYSSYIFLQKTAEAGVADDVFENQIAAAWVEWQGDVATANPFDGKRIGSALWEFRDFEEYDGIIYGKGSVFLQRLRATLGDSRFFQLLQIHFQNNKYGITTGRTFLREALDVAGGDAPAVRKLYLQWIEGRRR